MINRIIALLILTFHLIAGNAQNFQNSKLGGVLKGHIEKKNIPGMMISIVRKDTVIYVGGLGYSNIDSKEEVNGKHLFRLGSISKSFTSLALIHALANSPYDLNTPIKEIDSSISFINPWEATDPIRVKHLLEHTTGFEDFHPRSMYNRTDSIVPPAKEMVLSHKNSLVSRWKPGTMKAYCNPGYIIAGHIIEKISGESYGLYISKHILNPLNMPLSGYYFKKPQHLDMAQGYLYDGGVLYEEDFRSIQGGPAGEFCSNAEEMANYLRFMLSMDGGLIDSTIFTPQVFDRIENAETTIAAKTGLPGGYGLGNFSVWKNGHLFYGHDGGIDGFMSRYVYSREADIGVAISINRLGDATEIVEIILDHFLGKQKEINRATYPIPDEIKEKYAGFYGFKNYKRELFSFSDKMLAGLILDFQEDSIIARSILGKAKYTLHYAGNNMFYNGSEEIPSVSLMVSENGTPVLWINDSYTEMESRGWRLFTSLLVIFSLIIPFAFMAFALIRIVIRLVKKKKPVIRHPILWLAGISYLLMILGLSGALSNPYESGILTFNTALVYGCSLALLVFTAIAILRLRKITLKTRAAWYQLFVSVSFAITTGFFWMNGFIGLKLWTY